jgi:membrane protease YdiL (CAAX protease family)
VRCPACKKQFAAEKKFCPACGYQILERPADPAKQGVIAAAIIYIGTFVAFIAIGLFAPLELHSHFEDALWSLASYAGVALVCCAALRILGEGSFRESLAGPLTWRGAALGLAIGALGFFISASYVLVLHSFVEEEIDESQLEGAFAFALVATVVLPALIEEWSDRGVLWVALRRITGTGGTIFATSILFAMSHGLNEGYILEVPHRFVVGLLFGWLRLHTGSLWPGIIAHAVLNALAITVEF